MLTLLLCSTKIVVVVVVTLVRVLWNISSTKSSVFERRGRR